MFKTSLSTDSSTGATRFTIKYDKLDGGSDKLVEKLSKIWRIVKKSKNCQRAQKASKVWKICKNHRFGGTFTKVSVLCQQRAQASVKALTVFRALFARPRSSFNTTFRVITNRQKLVELLMLCHVWDSVLISKSWSFWYHFRALLRLSPTYLL